MAHNDSMNGMHKNFVYDQWLSQIVDRDAYRLIINDNFTREVSDLKSADCFQLPQLQSRPIFIYTKVPILSTNLIKFIAKMGFNLVDTNIVFDKPLLINREFTNNKCLVRFALPEDEIHVAELARNNFIYSRFHLDDDIPLFLANKIKAEWARNYFAGLRGDKMIVALVDDVIVGFLLLLESSADLIIDLIAVDNNYQRKGIASDMIAYVEYHLNFFSSIEVGTQLANIPSIRLYEKIGFRVCTANYVFHYHKTC